MVADLFGVGRAPVDPTLEGLPENGIEGLLHAQVKQRVGYTENSCPYQSAQHVLLLEFLE
jgi:hypothetical protein